MAIINGIIRKMAGSVGDFTFKQLNGQTVVSEKVTNMRNPRSDGQMKTRTKFTNIVAMYSLIRPRLRKAFETKPAGVSDYNMFMKVNMQKEPVYLTKQQVAGGACVVAPYQITQGSLPSIVVTGSGQSASTDIYLGATTINASTTIAQLSQAIVQNNPSFKYGDQISYFIVRQHVNAETLIPYAVCDACALVLDATNEDKVWDVLFHNGFYTQDSCLGHSGNDGDCAYCWVHTRKVNGKLLLSSQSLVSANTKLAEYQGDLAYNLARSSYGMSEDVFLSPTGGGSASTSDENGGGNSGGGGNDSL